jgi:hypothetical protein
VAWSFKYLDGDDLIVIHMTAEQARSFVAGEQPDIVFEPGKPYSIEAADDGSFRTDYNACNPWHERPDA